MRPVAIAATVMILGAGATMAAADDSHPYSGYFAAGLPDEKPDDIRLNCAHAFFRQDRDGSFVNYHIDAESYDRDGTIRYVRYGDGNCTLFDGGRIEACKMAFSTDAAEIGSVYVDVIDAIEPEVVYIRYFDQVEQAQTYLAGKGPPTDRLFFVRCTGLTDEVLAGRLTTEVSRLSLDQRDDVIAPELDAATRARLKGILDRLLANP
jgi:hypothetical protein